MHEPAHLNHRHGRGKARRVRLQRQFVATALGRARKDFENARSCQLQRLFRRVLGQTIQQYIIATRVHAAAYELAQTARNIAEIAFAYGFNDQSAFSNSFRAVMGTSPRAYRLRAGEGEKAG